jgi:hypothetical protein
MNSLQYNIQIAIASVLIAIGMSLASGATAEQIKVPIGQQATSQPVKMPSKGMSQSAVKATFGDPIETTPAKGQPPISSWKYSDFVVYFEYDQVIHSVAVFKPQEDREIILEE